MRVVCLRCQRTQEDKPAPIDSGLFFIGCKSCGYPYAVYAKPKEDAK